MRIAIEEAMRICEKYGTEEVPLILLKDVYLRHGAQVLQISAGMRFDPSQYELFVDSQIKEIEVVYTDRLFAKLAANFPEKYRLPLGQKSLIEMDKLLEQVDGANTMTKRKRHVIVLDEFYQKNTQGVLETVLGYGTELSYKDWNTVKSKLSRNAMINYRIDETGIIVFSLLDSKDPRYPQKFMQYTEVVSLVVESKKLGISLSPDFYPEGDVYTINEPTKLLTTYNDKKIGLILVVDEEIHDEYKRVLAQVKTFDRYARMLFIKKFDPAQKLEILKNIKKAYSQFLWQEE
ncbi:MAG: hypothetical protein N2314_02545 [Brevinematales bacterium]|nr:hypothetical protein [Brevinematales bacterium]